MPQEVAKKVVAISIAVAILLAMSLGIVAIAVLEHMQWVQNNLMNWVYTTWQVMFGSGVKTGMVAIVVLLRPILLVPLVGRTVCSVVAVGTIQPGTVGLRAVTILLLTAIAAGGFAWFSPSNDFFFRPKKSHLIRYDVIIEKYEEILFNIVVSIRLFEYRHGARAESQVV